MSGPEGEHYQEQADRLEVPACAAADLILRVDQYVNAGAIAEAAAATDGLQSPDEIRDGDESQYVDHGEYEFVPQCFDCNLCGKDASISRRGLVSAVGCIVSRSCERSWVDMHPEHFLNENGELKVSHTPCGGDGCSAILRLSKNGGKVMATIMRGECRIDVNGAEWLQEGKGRDLLNRMRPDYALSEDSLEPFDGEPLEDEHN